MADVAVEGDPCAAINPNTTPLLLHLVLLHDVLKWLHHPFCKYVILWQSVVASHDCLHFSRLEPFPGEFCMYTSPAFVSHATLEPTSCHVRAASIEVVNVSRLCQLEHNHGRLTDHWELPLQW